MKALAKLKAEPGLWMTDVPVPTIGDDDVLIKIKYTSVCGTDLHIESWDEWAQKTVPVPLVTGHEFMGIVEAIGSKVKGFKVGDRVSGEGHLVCGHCRNCRAGSKHLCRATCGVGYHCTGCFAEYFAMPASNVFLLPAEISDEVASILDPLGNAVHTTLAFDLVGEDVLITGAGPIGLMAIAIAKHVGARHIFITDINEYRLDLARKMGVTRAINVTKDDIKKEMDAVGMKEGFDVCLEMSGNAAAYKQILETINYGGCIAILGIPAKPIEIDWSVVIFKSLTLQGIYGRKMYETWYKMASMLQSGLNISSVVTHIVKIDDYKKAFEIARGGQAGKVVLDWT